MSNVKESEKSLIKRALEQPEQVKQVFEFFKNNGFSKTYQRIKGQLDGGKQTGYSISGVVIAAGEGVTNFQPGDRVAASGAGIANHAEYVDVPVNLVMRLPEGLDFVPASTATLGGIAMQGVRRADLNFGEVCVVVGAGILGLLAQQMLQVSGIRTLVVDLDNNRLDLARELGAERVINPTKEDPVLAAQNMTGGYGADAVLFTAATSSNEPLSQAFKMCRRKGRVVLVGVSGMEIKRGDIYKKELDFLISTSYGPGRYDNNYEGKGLDYPYSYVRWTENRNMQEYLRLLSEKKVVINKMVSKIYSIEQVEEAFESIKSSEGSKPLLTILDYGKEDLDSLAYKKEKVITNPGYKPVKDKVIQVALVGAGGFAKGMHLPNISKLSDKYVLRAVHNRTGFNAKATAEQYGAKYGTTNLEEILKDEEVDLILIATRHDSHAELVLKGLEAGKHVFVEKPLCVNQEELEKIKEFYNNGNKNKPVLMVGFNRRFSKYCQEIKRHTDLRNNPLFMRYRMNAGYFPNDHWVHDHGGRIIGEGCHIVDLMGFFTDSKVVSISAESISSNLSGKFKADDNRSIILKYEDGSVAAIDYFACGSKNLPKEMLEVHFDNKSIVMEDYKKTFGVWCSC